MDYVLWEKKSEARRQNEDASGDISALRRFREEGSTLSEVFFVGDSEF
jgi:hypothetical protein